ncbi:CDP-alcohol phosphatidyltransferase family protein, partial [Corynebacterium stationis]
MSSVGISKDSVNSSSGAAKPSNWNLPNVLTSLRILFIPVFVWLVLAEHQWWAFSLFAVLMA